MSAPLTDLQRDIEGYMLQCSNLNHLNIVVDDEGTLQSTAEQAVKTVKSRGGSIGIAAVLKRPTVSSANANMPGPQSDAIVSISIIENVLVNRGHLGSSIRADDMAFRVVNVLHRLQVGSKTLYAEPIPIRPVETREGFVVYELTLKTALHNQPLPKTLQPTIEESGGTVTLTSATPSAAFNYSIDGSYPSLTYTTPFSASSGDLVRAVATSDDLLPSSISELTID